VSYLPAPVLAANTLTVPDSAFQASARNRGDAGHTVNPGLKDELKQKMGK